VSSASQCAPAGTGAPAAGSIATNHRERDMKGILLWLIGIPIPIIILLYIFVFR